MSSRSRSRLPAMEISSNWLQVGNLGKPAARKCIRGGQNADSNSSSPHAGGGLWRSHASSFTPPQAIARIARTIHRGHGAAAGVRGRPFARARERHRPKQERSRHVRCHACHQPSARGRAAGRIPRQRWRRPHRGDDGCQPLRAGGHRSRWQVSGLHVGGRWGRPPGHDEPSDRIPIGPLCGTAAGGSQAGYRCVCHRSDHVECESRRLEAGAGRGVAIQPRHRHLGSDHGGLGRLCAAAGPEPLARQAGRSGGQCIRAGRDRV